MHIFNESIIHIWLVQIDVMEVAILLIYQVKYDLSNKAKDINLKVFDMITGINESNKNRVCKEDYV